MSSLREDRTKILEALMKGPKTREELLELTGIKPTTFHTSRIPLLMKRGEIETYDDPQDRRITLYRIPEERKENATAQVMAEEILAKLRNLFEESSVELTTRLLFEFTSWLEKQGHEDLAKRALGRYEIVDKGDNLLLRNRETRSILPIVIRKGTTRAKVGNLYREREKAWPRFLEEYYPNIKTPIHDLEDRKLVKKIRDEFEEYWNKEYWEDRDRRSR